MIPFLSEGQNGQNTMFNVYSDITFGQETNKILGFSLKALDSENKTNATFAYGGAYFSPLHFNY